MVIWRWTYYGKGPFKYRKGKPVYAPTWTTLSEQLGLFYMHHPTDRIAMEHGLEREIAP